MSFQPVGKNAPIFLAVLACNIHRQGPEWTCLVWMNFDLQIRLCVEMQLKCKLCQGPWVVRMEVK